jgi:hypothetical protein
LVPEQSQAIKRFGDSVLGVLGRMDLKARRLIDHNEPFVLVKDSELHKTAKEQASKNTHPRKNVNTWQYAVLMLFLRIIGAPKYVIDREQQTS